jgi:hypothetical protein
MSTSGSQNVAGASSAATAAQPKAPRIASRAGRLQSALTDQGIGKGIATTAWHHEMLTGSYGGPRAIGRTDHPVIARSEATRQSRS